jgi:hypothetical protein
VAQSLPRCDCLVCILRTRSLGGARLSAKVVLPWGWYAWGGRAGQLQLPRYVSVSLVYSRQQFVVAANSGSVALVTPCLIPY